MLFEIASKRNNANLHLRVLELQAMLAHLGVAQNQGYHFGGPNCKNYDSLGSISGCHIFMETTM